MARVSPTEVWWTAPRGGSWESLQRALDINKVLSHHVCPFQRWDGHFWNFETTVSVFILIVSLIVFSRCSCSLCDTCLFLAYVKKCVAKHVKTIPFKKYRSIHLRCNNVFLTGYIFGGGAVKKTVKLFQNHLRAQTLIRQIFSEHSSAKLTLYTSHLSKYGDNEAEAPRQPDFTLVCMTCMAANS